MIEMDRFVVTLKGKREEEIVRQSKDSASTMKQENGMTINRMTEELVELVELSSDTNRRTNVLDSFCGLPHNLYLPK